MADLTENTCEVSSEGGQISLSGSLRHGGQKNLLRELVSHVDKDDAKSIDIDISGITRIDSLGVSLLAELEVQSRLKGKSVKFINTPPDIENSLEQYYYPAPEVREDKEDVATMEKIGSGFYSFLDTMGHLIILISESIYWTFVALWNPKGHRRGAIAAQALQIGVNALPVIAVISFLIGIVLALQSAGQLRQFGANIFVADLVVIAMTREMGPLMTAVLLAGRSGAAIAAEISSMTVNEETDALVTMALKPIRYVVVPKIIGIIITAPLLTILATLVGIFGGFLVAVNSLDLTPQAFFQESQKALFLWDVITGQIKSVVFAWLIVILAAFYGFRVKGGPEGVGRATTSSVVASIFAVIVADAILGLLFYL